MRFKNAFLKAIQNKDMDWIKYYFSKDNKTERRSYRLCMKRVKATRKKMKKLVECYGPWEWGYIHDFIELAIRDMYEYYNEGDNVWQEDSSRLKNVNQLLKAINLFEEIGRFEDNVNPKDYANIDDYLADEQKTYDDFYTHLGKNIRWWWD